LTIPCTDRKRQILTLVLVFFCAICEERYNRIEHRG
jgi:hypothetical protein